MHAALKKDVIEYLSHSSIGRVERRKMYRAWCGATFTKFRREDVDRVAPAPDRDMNRDLFTC